jgi:FAD:protein FMN transferase
VKETRILMGMPVTLEVAAANIDAQLFESVFGWFEYVDRKFSTYKEESEISLLNRGELQLQDASQDMQMIFALAESTRQETGGYFDIQRGSRCDPSGIVKGWAILRAAQMFRQAGCDNYYVDAGGDIQAGGMNAQGRDWQVGIQNPFNPLEIIKVIGLHNCGVATSGTYVRGRHIYDPTDAYRPVDDLVSLTVVGPDVFEADRFATAAFAMGPAGIAFIEQLDGFEGYMVDPDGLASYTSGFERVVVHA